MKNRFKHNQSNQKLTQFGYVSRPNEKELNLDTNQSSVTMIKPVEDEKTQSKSKLR